MGKKGRRRIPNNFTGADFDIAIYAYNNISVHAPVCDKVENPKLPGRRRRIPLLRLPGNPASFCTLIIQKRFAFYYHSHCIWFCEDSLFVSRKKTENNKNISVTGGVASWQGDSIYNFPYTWWNRLYWKHHIQNGYDAGEDMRTQASPCLKNAVALRHMATVVPIAFYFRWIPLPGFHSLCTFSNNKVFGKPGAIQIFNFVILSK